MKNKRFLSMALSAAMAMSLAVPAFAAETNTETTITGKYQEAVIDVVVPQTGNAFINPYGLGTSVDLKDSDGKVQIKGQVVTAPMYITNNSDLILDVGATITTTLGEKATMKLAAATTKGSGKEGDADYVAPATAKSAYVYVQGASSAVTSADDAIDDDEDDAITAEYAADATWASAVSSAPLSTKPVTVEKLGQLTANILDEDGAVEKYVAGNFLLYRLTGDCVKTPKEAWTADDTFTVKIAFTFAPGEAPAQGGQGNQNQGG